MLKRSLVQLLLCTLFRRVSPVEWWYVFRDADSATTSVPQLVAASSPVECPSIFRVALPMVSLLNTMAHSGMSLHLSVLL